MLKSTGIVRKVDHLGRVVIPKELRTVLAIKDNDPLEIYTDGDRIVLKKYAPGCCLCGNIDRPITSLYPDKQICTGCIDIIVKDQNKLKGGN